MSIRTSTQDGVACIGLARPERKNAITLHMYDALAAAIDAAERDAAVFALLIHGDAAVFSAGNDIEDFLAAGPLGPEAPPVRFMRALAGAAKPVIAAVNGPAVGIGTTMLLHCDLVYAADNAQFSLPFVNLGLCPEFGASLLLPLAAGYHVAAEKLLFGEPIGAEEAVAMGLVNRLLPPAEVFGYALRQGARLRALPPEAVRASKRLLKSAWRTRVEQVIDDELAEFALCLARPESKEAFRAFLERRKPDFARAAQGGAA